jgi:nicotinate phosphoribosyltransferase
VYRSYDNDGLMAGDILTTADVVQSGQPLLVPVMQQGRRLGESPALDTVRDRARVELAKLPVPLRALTPAASPYCVTVAPPLIRLAAEVDQRTHFGK